MIEIKAKAKEIHTKGEHLRSVIERTMGILSNIVGVTLGPGGNPVLLDRPGMPPLVTKDGVTVALASTFSDSLEHTIAEAAKETCQRTNQEVGDGTTTAIVLAHALTVLGLNALDKDRSISPQSFCRELDKLEKLVIDEIDAHTIPVDQKSDTDLLNVARISTNGDEEAAKAVVEAVKYVGEDGSVLTEEGTGSITHIEKFDGYTINRGLHSLGSIQDSFVTHPKEQECRFQEPYVVLFDGEISYPEEIGPYLQAVIEAGYAQKGRVVELLIVAHKFSPQVLTLLSLNAQKGVRVCPLETPSSGHPLSKQGLLYDLAAYTGAKVFDAISHTFKHGSVSDAGVVETARIGRYTSVLYGPPNAQAIAERIDILKGHLDKAESQFDADLIRERIGKLNGGVATIYAGGNSDLEMKERKHRIEDAVNAVRAAIEGGLVPGGGATLARAACYLELKDDGTGSAARRVLMEALLVPVKRILSNMGMPTDKIQEVLNKVKWTQDKTLTFDALTGQYVSAVSGGVIDPAKVTLTAFKNALSIAKMLMTLGGAIVIPRDKTEERQAELQAQAFAESMQGA